VGWPDLATPDPAGWNRAREILPNRGGRLSRMARAVPRSRRAGPPPRRRQDAAKTGGIAMHLTTRIDPHAQVRALYGALLESEERFHEFKRQLALYDVRADEVQEEPASAAVLRQKLNESIRSWLKIPFDGISAVQMLQWRAIVVEERFNVSVSPWKESNNY